MFKKYAKNEAGHIDSPFGIFCIVLLAGLTVFFGSFFFYLSSSRDLDVEIKAGEKKLYQTLEIESLERDKNSSSESLKTRFVNYSSYSEGNYYVYFTKNNRGGLIEKKASTANSEIFFLEDDKKKPYVEIYSQDFKSEDEVVYTEYSYVFYLPENSFSSEINLNKEG